MKLDELFKPRPKKKYKIRRPIVKHKGNDQVVYLGTDAVKTIPTPGWQR